MSLNVRQVKEDQSIMSAFPFLLYMSGHNCHIIQTQGWNGILDSESRSKLSRIICVLGINYKFPKVGRKQFCIQQEKPAVVEAEFIPDLREKLWCYLPAIIQSFHFDTIWRFPLNTTLAQKVMVDGWNRLFIKGKDRQKVKRESDSMDVFWTELIFIRYYSFPDDYPIVCSIYFIQPPNSPIP